MPLNRRKFIKYSLLSGFGIAAIDAFWFEKYFIETNEFYIQSANSKTNNIKIIQVSDLHLRQLSSQYESLAETLNKLQPDLIVFTGDSIDKAKNTTLLKSFLKLINKDIQKAAILGNWEYWGKVDISHLSEIYFLNNCKLLINENVEYKIKNKSILVSGLDDFIGGNSDYDKTVEKISMSDYHIVLNHCPEYADYILSKNNCKVDLILSGHTHGGQLNLFGFKPFLPRGSGNYVRGWYHNNKMYVSKGIGTSVFPARFGSRAEISVFNLLA